MHERMSHVKESEKICEPFSVWSTSSDVAPKGLWVISSDPQLCVWKECAIRSVERRMCSFTPPVWKLGRMFLKRAHQWHHNTVVWSVSRVFSYMPGSNIISVHFAAWHQSVCWFDLPDSCFCLLLLLLY